jgi:Polysaccharide pyruvyl transferase
MEPLDRVVCEGLARRIGAPPPLLAREHEADELVATRRASSRLVSSRLHAVILSMSAGVPAIGLGFDRRIRSVLDEAGHPEQVLDVDDPALETRLAEALDRTRAHASRPGRDLRRGRSASSGARRRWAADCGSRSPGTHPASRCPASPPRGAATCRSSIPTSRT